MALYNEVRPRTLSELKGQEDVVRILRKSVAGGTLPNAMLFTGTRGTGKTTVARVISKMVNCEHPAPNGDPCCECTSCRLIGEGQSLDVTELDAASNNGVDDVRRIVELVQYERTSKMRVIILDETHMLSQGAFNALLKVLEEPPEGVLFILCTTESHKIPPTILSRCRRFPFKELTMSQIVEKLSRIAADKGKTVEDGALMVIAKAAKGSMRDAESIFESFLETEEITESGVRRVLGYSSEERIIEILGAVAKGMPWVIRDALRDAVERGENLYRFVEDTLEDLVKMSSVMLDGDIGETGGELASLCHEYGIDRIFDMIEKLRKVYEAKPDNMEVSLLAAFVGTACMESRMDALERELEEMKRQASSSAGYLKRIPSADAIPAEARCGADAEDAALQKEDSEFSGEGAPIADDQQDFPFAGEDKATTDKVPDERVALSPVQEPSKSRLSPKALKSLIAAGFVVEGASSDEGDAAGTGAGTEREAPTRKKEQAESLFDEFEALFKF